jgi:hypothetical protein
MCVKWTVIVFREFDFSVFRMTDLLVLGFRSREDLYNASSVLILGVLHAAGYERKPTLHCCSSKKQSKVTVVPCYLLYCILAFGVIGIVASLRAGRFGFRIRAGITDFSLLHNVQTGCRANPASSSAGTGDSFRRSKTAGVRGCPLSSM